MGKDRKAVDAILRAVDRDYGKKARESRAVGRDLGSKAREYRVVGKENRRV